jgi:hypothetical protein
MQPATDRPSSNVFALSRLAGSGALVLLCTAACAAKDGDGPRGNAACRIDATSELSTAIPTVGIVTWTTTLAALDAAHIEFGRSTSYGMTAPVDLEAPSYRTLLLGMTPATEYHFRVVASAGSESCTSADYALTTGPIANGLSLPTVVTIAPDEVAPGFLLASRFASSGPGPSTGSGPGPRQMPQSMQGEGGGPGSMLGGESGGPSGMMLGEAGASGGVVIGAGGAPGMTGNPDPDAGESMLYILDQDGAPVWWLNVPLGEVSRVLMSYDGKSMLALSLNVAGSSAGRAVKVSMDGLDVRTLDVPNAHHDFTVTPNDGAVFIRKSDDGCDDLMELSSGGDWRRVFRVADAFGNKLGAGVGGERCHTNSVHYNAADDSFTCSVLNMNSYVKVSAAGELEWVLGGAASDFSGDGAEWRRQHGHQLLSADRLLFFNNGDAGDTSSIAREVELEPNTGIAKRVWAYDGGLSSAVLGDVQRLPNGNTLVAYSTAGMIHEVTPNGALVRTLEWPIGGAFGFVNHRPSLYGPPP